MTEEKRKLVLLSVEDFASDLASAKPAPGGGAAAALTAATAAALVAMVANLTLANSKYSDRTQEMEVICVRADELRMDLLKLLEADAIAFTDIMTAMRLAKNTPEEIELRSQRLAAALRHGANVPYETARLAAEIFPLAKAVIKRGTPHAITDGAIAALQGACAIRAALYNVRINLSSLQDKDFVLDMRQRVVELEEQAKIGDQIAAMIPTT